MSDDVRDVASTSAGGGPAGDAPGFRSIRLEVEVRGTPDDVWEAVATGPGISSWFVPAAVEPRAGGSMTLSFGPGMEQVCRVTDWEPPRRFGYGAPEESDSPIGYEFVIEPAGPDRSVVRLVNRGFAAGPESDAEYTAMYGGWRLFLTNLRLYREHFPGQYAVSVVVNGASPGPRDKAFVAMVASLGLPPLAEASPAATAAHDVPALGGTVARLADGMVTFVVDEPVPGLAFFAAEGDGESIYMSFYGYFFGADAAAVVARDEPRWRAWMDRTFPTLPAP